MRYFTAHFVNLDARPFEHVAITVEASTGARALAKAVQHPDYPAAVRQVYVQAANAREIAECVAAGTCHPV